MSTDFRELVGLQATFDNGVARYRFVHYYRWKRIAVVEPIMEMAGYDVERTEDVADIVASLRNAYKAVELSVWKSTTVLEDSYYVQFRAKATPKDLALDGIWSTIP